MERIIIAIILIFGISTAYAADVALKDKGAKVAVKTDSVPISTAGGTSGMEAIEDIFGLITQADVIVNRTASSLPVVVVADGDTNPGVNDDIDTATGAATPVVSGYIAGDVWINDTASPTKIFQCISNGDGAANWDELLTNANAGTDVTADLEEETHASEHTIGGADITDRLFEGVTVAAITVGDATPPVASKGLYITTGATAITITDFYDSGDDNDGDFADGDYFGLILEDVDVIIDFATGTNIKGNADTNLTGLASNPLLLIFVWRSGVWYCVNFNSGFSNALTMAAKINMVVTAISGNDTLTAAEQWNGRVFVSAASVLNAAGVAEGMEVVIVSHTADDVDFNPDDADQISLNGAAADTAGDAVRLTNIGEILTCTGISTSVWNCSTDAGVAQ